MKLNTNNQEQSMSVSKFFVRALLVAAGFAVATSNARADLFIRASAYDSGGALVQTTVTQTSVGNSTGLSFTFGNVGNFSGVGASLTPSAIVNGLSLSLSNSFTNNVGGSTQHLVIEYMITGIVSPTSQITLSESASTSSSGYGSSAGTGFLNSGVRTATIALPNTPPGANEGAGNLGALGFSAIANTSGNYSPGIATFYTPNPSASAGNIVSPFAIYSVFSSGTTSAGGPGSFAATVTGSTASAVPEPATIFGALVGIGGLGIAKLRRRKTAVAA
jgi:hypothetical protein